MATFNDHEPVPRAGAFLPAPRSSCGCAGPSSHRSTRPESRARVAASFASRHPASERESRGLTLWRSFPPHGGVLLGGQWRLPLHDPHIPFLASLSRPAKRAEQPTQRPLPLGLLEVGVLG